MKNIHKDELISKFRFTSSGRASFSEVDSFDVVHNIRYLYWLEDARLDYFENIGIKMHPNTIKIDFPVMVVKNEINYLAPILFTEKYIIYSRVAELNNSSLIFENIILKENGQISAIANSVLVYLDKDEMKSKRIPDEVREMIINFEQNNLIIKE